MSSLNAVRFGIFEFDLTTLELRRLGAPVSLQSQPSKVLAVLVEHAGDVVSRESLQAAVWKTDTHVDFERGLNFCIAQIRAALGDSAESPKFLRTLPKRGYQFIAPVARISPADPKSDAPMIAPAPSKRMPAWRIAVITVAILGALGIYTISRRNTQQSRAQAPVKIAVALFDNETGNPELDNFTAGLTDQVVAELTMAGVNKYDVIGNASILRVPRDQRDLNAIASTLQSTYVILGQVQQSGNRVRILAHLIRMPDQTHVSVTRTERTLEDPLGLQTELARLIGAKFDEKLSAGSN
jgi:DNA-binding winged helix-turn-helix (wHTH) protein/TolB-like protein